MALADDSFNYLLYFVSSWHKLDPLCNILSFEIDTKNQSLIKQVLKLLTLMVNKNGTNDILISYQYFPVPA